MSKSKIRHLFDGTRPSLDRAIIPQNAIKPGFFVTSGRYSGEIESEFQHKLCKTNPIFRKVK